MMDKKCTLREQLEGITVEGKPRRVARNTVRYTSGGKEFLRYHMTDIIVKDLATGILTLNSGGWRTSTTKERINSAVLPGQCRVWQEEGFWRLRCRPPDAKTAWGEMVDILFFDGMRIDKDGKFIGEIPSKRDIEAMRERKKEGVV